MKKALLAGSLLVTSPVWGAASGGDLYASCNSAPGTAGDQNCSSYINGFVNGVLLDQIGREQGYPICIPNGTNTAQVRDVVKKFLEAHPAVLNVESGPLVARAITDAFPCPKSN